MKRLKNLALLCVCFLGLGISSFAQSITPVKSIFKIDDSIPITNKVTGERITQEEFKSIIQKKPRVSLERQIDERGRVSSLIYDPNGSTIITRDPNSRTKPNQPFPNFIFTSTANETIDLKDLGEKIVVLYFNMGLKEPLASQKMFINFENTLKVSPYRNKILPLIIAQSSAEEIADFTERVRIPYPIVANGVNFFEKYIIINIPSFIVIKGDGTLGAYADDLDELKEVLLKLN